MRSSLRIISLLFIIPVATFGGTIQAASPNSVDMPTAIQATNQTIVDARALINFAYNVQQLVANNYQFTVPGTNEVVQMTSQQQSDMYASYTQLKSALQADIAKLP